MVDEKYINSLSVEELRRELIHSLEVQYGILYAIRDLPEMPTPFVLLHLNTASKYPEDANRGKQLQQKYGLIIIPPKHECECGAGLWERIRTGLLNAATP